MPIANRRRPPPLRGPFAPLVALGSLAVAASAAEGGIVQVEAAADRGFHWPYLLHVPPPPEAGGAPEAGSLLVLPNNTGSGDDDFAVHERQAKRAIEQIAPWTSAMGVIALMPVFPRPRTEWRIYTHALDRDALSVREGPLARIDLQLLAMIDDALARLRAEGLRVEEKVLMHGFSASGMFVDRFVFLHPERVKAAAIGSPGGWPIAPVAEHEHDRLRYPIGIADVEELVGKPVDLAALARVPLLFFMGDQDENDSVDFRDSYEAEDEVLIDELFGATPVERWPHAQELHRAVLPLATFKLYPKVAHSLTAGMRADLQAFFREHRGGGR